MTAQKIVVETIVAAPIAVVWRTYVTPADIKQWNAASDDWHTTESAVDLREGGIFSSRMEAKDGSAGFDFTGTYTRVVDQKMIGYTMDDGRAVKVEFDEGAEGVLVKETFEAETQNDVELQRKGWQAILDNFARHVEMKR